jgi:DNA replication protein DnaC
MQPNTDKLPVLLKSLKLSQTGKLWKDKGVEAKEKGWSHSSYLTILCEEEVADRYHKRVQRYIRESHLPPSKTLSSFNFLAAETINKLQIEDFATDTDWINQSKNLLFFGASGVGKTHLAAAIGYSLIEKDVRVKFVTAMEIVQTLQKAKQDLVLIDALSKLDKFQLLIIDDIGYVKKSDRETQVLFELIAHRYESGSLIITANQPFSEWDSIFSDRLMTVAAIDRIVHHATIIQCNDESFRKKCASENHLHQFDKQTTTA